MCIQACAPRGGPAGGTAAPVITQAPTPAAFPLPSPSPFPASIPGSEVVWHTGFETGDITQLQAHGDFVRQGAGSFHLVTPHAHTGRYSAALTIDTQAWSPTGNHAAYLFFWDQLPQDSYYYSAWYYIPSRTKPGDWWNIWQWKSTYDGDTDHSQPIFELNVSRASDHLALALIHKLPGHETTRYTQRSASVPTDQWFHLEAFYERAKDESGQVIVWQDGREIFDVSHVQTVLTDSTIYWSVNNYTDRIEPDPCTIFVDDMAISKTRLGSQRLP
jgi:hypothetical protein